MENTEEYALFGKMTAQPGQREALLSILLQAAQLVSTAKGCHQYLVYKDTQHQDCIWISEIWDSKADHDASLTIAGCKELIMQAMPLLAGKPERTELTLSGGKR
ncbi:antibiotic biosynthesis monooxygenase [Nibribacter ruber]|uniref:Antibiotic biosynthesis monooxygenase n=1 Tax=Nibribacter ruber TaxID=2698458 RepID=A0A6P1NXH4_9BACT|nr:antibiotic biosynthesis monooxygenase [Nibribacter ruber]QHL87024.1 antibiotic biosynthesis monooxygenase [Nibribacter ruber]